MFEEHIFSLFICSDIQESHFGEVSYSARHSIVSDPLPPMAQQAPLSMGFSSKNTGVRCHLLLQGIFPTQGLNLCLLHCRQILYCLKHPMLGWQH